MKISAAAYCAWGGSCVSLKKETEAILYFSNAAAVFSQLILGAAREQGRTIDPSASFDKIAEPSIFDNEEINLAKEQLKEVLCKIDDCKQSDAINKKLEQIKAETEKQTQADAAFGKPMANADQFKLMTFPSKKDKDDSKKRTFNQMVEETKKDDPTLNMNQPEAGLEPTSMKRKNSGS